MYDFARGSGQNKNGAILGTKVKTQGETGDARYLLSRRPAGAWRAQPCDSKRSPRVRLLSRRSSTDVTSSPRCLDHLSKRRAAPCASRPILWHGSRGSIWACRWRSTRWTMDACARGRRGPQSASVFKGQRWPRAETFRTTWPNSLSRPRSVCSTGFGACSLAARPSRASQGGGAHSRASKSFGRTARHSTPPSIS